MLPMGKIQNNAVKMDNEKTAWSTTDNSLSPPPKTKRLFAEFNDQSTVHGVKYAFGTENSLFRRFIWALLFFTCACLVAVDVADRIIHYMKHPVSLNLQVKYNDTMEFPAVTICNQNAFRRTLAKENGHYEVIKKVFEESDNSSLTDLQDFSTVYMEDLYVKNGHKAEDLIVRCRWRGEVCLWSHFTPVLTKHGLCYTFKGMNEKDRMIVDNPGVSNGLELVINAEEYDNMVGPHNSGGIKVVLHRQNEVPLPSEYGHELPTGRHGFMNVEVSQSTHLGAPHGTCESRELMYLTMYKYTAGACNMECEMSHVSSMCKCREIHMPKAMYAYPPCTVDQYEKCVTEAHVSFRKTNRQTGNCACPMSCNQFRYQPHLSYGSISKFSSNQMSILGDDKLRQRFIAARELAFREEMDYVTLEDLYKLLHEKRLPEFYKVLEDLEHVDNTLSVSGKETKALEEGIRQAFSYLYNEHIVYKKYASEMLDFNAGPFGVKPGDVMELLSYFDGQIQVMVSTDKIERKEAYYSMLMTKLNMKTDAANNLLKKETYFLPWLQEQYPDIWISNAKDFGTDTKPIINSTNTNITSNNVFTFVKESIHYLDAYKDIATKSLNRSYVNQSLLVDLNGALTASVVRFEEEKAKIETFYNVSVIANIKGLAEVLRLRLDPLSKVTGDFDKKCTTMYMTKAIRDASMYLMSSDDLLCKYINDTSSSSEAIRKLFHSNQMKYFIEEVRSFASGTFEDSELKMESVDCLEMVFNAYIGILPWYQAVIPALKGGSDTLVYKYEMDENYLKTNASLSSIKSFMFDKMKWLEVVHLLEKITEIMEDLKKSMKTDQTFYRDNFLHLNFLFQEFRYEKITQQMAYSLFGLLGDVGGAMGLFIGASVLSLFEIIDFAVILVRVMLSKRSTKASVVHVKPYKTDEKCLKT